MPVQKAGHKLCYQHWKGSQSKVSEPSGGYDISATKSAEAKQSMTSYLSSTELGERLGLSSRRLNLLLAELGWIEQEGKGWVPTIQGKKLYAERAIYKPTQVPFVRWPEAILTSRILRREVEQMLDMNEDGQEVIHLPATEPQEIEIVGTQSNFREKFRPTHRTKDGHWVRSKAEALIDNWLYESGVAHAYERRLPIVEEAYCDFYIPSGKVYIEYWGLESDPKYQARKKQKLEIYKEHQYSLIELNDDQIKNLDDLLPPKLLRFGVKVT